MSAGFSGMEPSPISKPEMTHGGEAAAAITTYARFIQFFNPFVTSAYHAPALYGLVKARAVFGPPHATKTQITK